MSFSDKRSFPDINVGRVKTILFDLLQIKSENPFDNSPSPGFREAEVGEYLERSLAYCGLETETREIAPGRVNVFGTLKGSGERESVMLAGHLDTAPSDNWQKAYQIEEKDGKIYGRGACDMKAALAAYLEVVNSIKDSGITLKGDLIIAGICDEEYQMIGSKDIGKNGPHAAFGIIGEPSNLLVCPANRGQLGATIETYGVSVHSSVPERGVNAICHMSKIIEAFSDYTKSLEKVSPHPLLGRPSFNIGTIQGGTILSAVPDRCRIEIDRRFLPHETVDSIYNEYHSVIDPLVHSVPGFRYSISEPTWNIPANDVNPEEAGVKALLQASGKVLHEDASPMPFVAGSDAPHLGFPTVICGPGDLGQAHSNAEFVSTEQLIHAVEIYLETIRILLC